MSGYGIIALRGFGSLLTLLPLPLWRFDDQTLLDGGRGNADITNLSIHHSLHPLQIREKTPLRDGRNVRADTPAFLGLTAAPNDAAFHGPFAR